MDDPTEVVIRLRERNQLTLPDRVAQRIGAKEGDRFLIRFDPAEPDVVRFKRFPDSYAGIATGVYGNTTEEHVAYVREERASWERDARPADAAADGTPYLSFEESKRVYWQTEVTRERYDREPKLRWPKCEVCGRSIRRMNDHRAAHRVGLLTDKGINTDPRQQERSTERVAKWRRTVAAKQTKKTNMVKTVRS